MGNFFAELKRRHVYRVVAAYTVAAWVVLQIVNNVIPIMEAPAWVARVVLLLLVLGFPVAALLAWMFDATPEGLKRTEPGTGAPSRTHAVDWIVCGALAAVIVLIVYEQLVSQPGTRAVQQAAVVPPTPQVQSAAISIAVLPFANVSADRDQEFFSDGMTDEINAALAKVPDLGVVARTSAFQFKGQNQDARMVGQTLGATHIIEGSVRKAGARVRITAQLARTTDGLSLWSETYDRDLTDIFAVQEDIARAIAGALRVPLGLKQGESLVSYRTGDIETYQQYLRARERYRAFATDEAVAILEPVVARDPSFASAWALLARSYSGVRGLESGLRAGRMNEQQRRVRETNLDREENAARKAVALDAKYGASYSALASVLMFRGTNWAASEDLYRQALMLDSNDAETLLSYILFLNASGRFKQALSVAEQLRRLEPLVPAYTVIQAYLLLLSGQIDASVTLLESVSASGFLGVIRGFSLSTAHAMAGRYMEAADTLLAIPAQTVLSRKSIEDAARLLRSAPQKVADPNALPALEGELRFVYVFVGAEDRVFDYADRAVEIGASYGSGIRGLWDPPFAAVRKTERFKQMIRTIGLVDYWKARGWPDLCRPVGADDFVCD